MDSNYTTPKEIPQESIQIAKDYEKSSSGRRRILLSCLVVAFGILIISVFTYILKQSNASSIGVVLLMVSSILSCISLIYNFIIFTYQRRRSLFLIKSKLVHLAEMELVAEIEANIEARLKRETV